LILTVESQYVGEDGGRQVVLYLYHSLESGPNAGFVYRGSVSLPSLQPTTTSVVSGTTFTPADRQKLKALVQKDGFYRLKVSRSNETHQDAPTTYMKACSLYEAELQEKLTIYLDAFNEIFSVSLMSVPSPCTGSPVSDLELTNFLTALEIRQMEQGPSPETAAYVQKVEREKAEKAKGDHGDNRSFFSKYWMYIVPIVIFVLLSSAASPDAQGGGGQH
jgi:hypothetical protein